ncbi:hypothetical protein GLAREA_12791 [Glarea lozoyensis ATCC 20868]|uniref:Uncharacterized protein n=1 Tax=Glarea lozoyensis (strain ATCC 20868 / MF5171) TaxID=1116229 RepID=S3DUG3_GLAL2|nr:uncharacterized protein GLAREA_12791 [Glarea lozoyensis ATCC 20868]EPE30068.1 hypothetical protein GLAREA_12791 [Glarea lozoyensis ATCC 20868]
MLFNIALISSLAAAVIAAPAPVPQTTNNPTYSWDVTGWSAGCARAGCYYDFNITAPAHGTNPTVPAFSAYCSGSENGFGLGGDYRACNIFDDLPANRGVVAKLLPAPTGSGAHIQVSLQWTDLEQASTYYNYTGHANSTYNQFVAPLQSFKITPTEFFGVA